MEIKEKNLEIDFQKKSTKVTKMQELETENKSLYEELERVR